MRPMLSATSRKNLARLSRSLLTFTRTRSILLPKPIFAWIWLMPAALADCPL